MFRTIAPPVSFPYKFQKTLFFTQISEENKVTLDARFAAMEAECMRLIESIRSFTFNPSVKKDKPVPSKVQDPDFDEELAQINHNWKN